MTFEQAALKLQRIANGKYHAVEFKLTTLQDSVHGPAERKTECVVYLDGFKHYSGVTWMQAFEKLDAAMNGKPQPECIEEISHISDEVKTC